MHAASSSRHGVYPTADSHHIQAGLAPGVKETPLQAGVHLQGANMCDLTL